MNLFLQFKSNAPSRRGSQWLDSNWLLLLTLSLSLSLFTGASTLFAKNGNALYDVCDDVTDGGTISGDETGCADPIFDPALITSTSPATGGSNVLEYLWMSTTDSPDGVSAIWNIIPGSSGETFDPGPITETTYYRRCSRRVGCSIWIQESNTVTKEVECAPGCDLDISNMVGVNPMCNPGNTGIVAVSITGGTAPYTYSWNNGSSTEDIDNLPAGTYCLTVSDANGCTDSGCVTLTAPAPIEANGQFTSATCGQNNGEIDLNVVGGTGPYTYAWNNGATTEDIYNLAAGTYCVVITDSKGCKLNQCYVVSDSGTHNVSITPSHSNVCPGQSVYLTASAGSSSYTWSTNGGSLSSNTGQSVNYTMNTPGTYTITVTGTNGEGCSATSTATVTVNENPNISGNTSNAACGVNNGAIYTTTTGGSAPYTYTWDNGASTSNLSNLMAGQYCVTVYDANGCADNTCFNVQGTTNLNVSLNTTNIGCNNLGSVSASVNGGAAPYTYAWSNGATSASINGLSAGNYCVVVTDANGCVNNQCTTLSNVEEVQFTANTQDPTCNSANGAINITITNGVAATYNWSNGASSANIQNLAAGTYTVTVTAAQSGCTSTATYNLSNQGDLSVSLASANPSCNGNNNGSVSANASYAGSGSLSYSWSNSATSSSIDGLAAGTYCVTITSSDGCVATSCATLVEPIAVTITEQITNTSCGESDGAIMVTASNGVAPYTYAWNNGASGSQINNLAAGQYCVTATDANDCTVTECYTIQSSTVISTSAQVTNITCNALGSIAVTPSGGSAPYSYSWDSGQTTSSISGLTAGTYCAVVTDANGCASTECVTLVDVEEVTLTGTSQNPTCELANGSINTTVTNGVATTYVWSNGATTADLQSLAAGSYSVTATAISSGCTATASYTLVNEGELAVSVNPTNPFCEGADNGSVTTTTSYSGTGTLLYTWNTGATSSTINDLDAGTYCVTVSSTDGCEATACTTLTAPVAVNANGIVGAASCGADDGNIKLNVMGGTAPYTYKWDTGATTKDIEALAAGTYCITICDAAGCIFNGCFTVAGGSDFNTSITNTEITCATGSDASATITAVGGTAPYTYTWSTGSFATSNSASNSENGLSAGTYCATVTDVFGCSSTACVTIDDAPELSIAASATPTSCGTANGTATVTAPFTPASIAWSGQGTSGTTSTINNLAAGTYTVVVTNDDGCTAFASVNVANSTDLNTSITPSNSTICPGEEITLNGSSSQATGVTYAWTTTGGNLGSNASANTTYTMMMPGTYTVTLVTTNAEGCTASDQATITVRDEDDPICNPTSDQVNIGDYVWFDSNNNGIQDDGELGIEGIKVKLLTAGPDGEFYTADDVMVDMIVTNENGYYLFTDVAPNEYVIMFCLDLPGTEYTSQDVGTNDLLDSDANPTNGKTDPFTVTAGQDDDLSFDAGVILTPSGCDNITSGGEIAAHQMVCGAGAIPDLITNTTLPSGGSGAIEYLWMTTTIGGPFDMNTWTVIAGATGSEYQPSAVTQTIYIARCARRVGCTTYKESNIIKIELKQSPVVSIESLPAFICVGETDNFNSTSGGNAVTYSWNLGEGASPATATGQHLTNVQWNTPGTKTITLTTTNLNCTFVVTRTVEVGSCLNQESNLRFIHVQSNPIPESMDVDLNWSTSEGMNDYKFVIEHSADGEEFNIIYTMDGNDAFESKDYAFMDTDAREGRNYYRIKHINNNGKTEKSEEVMSILVDQADKFIVFPNPTQDYVVFESLKLTQDQGTIVVSDMKGVILQEIVIPANTERKTIDISNYPPGLYTFYIQYHNVRSVPRQIYKMED